MVVPGLFYSADGPLLMFAGLAAVERRGGSVRRISWTVPQFGGGHRRGGPSGDRQVAGVAGSTRGRRPGPADWLTPILTGEPAVAAMRRATAPCLLIGGTADKAWDGQLTRSLTPHVLQIDGADHGMFVPGRPSKSAAVLGQVTTAVENFLDHQV